LGKKKVKNIEKVFDLVLDSKGKTGCIEVVFNGIDSNSLRLGQLASSPNTAASTPSSNEDMQIGSATGNGPTLSINLQPAHRASASLNEQQHTTGAGGSMATSTSDSAINATQHPALAPSSGQGATAAVMASDSASSAAATASSGGTSNNGGGQGASNSQIISYLSQGLLPG
jgi:hypothetical protein